MKHKQAHKQDLGWGRQEAEGRNLQRERERSRGKKGGSDGRPEREINQLLEGRQFPLPTLSLDELASVGFSPPPTSQPDEGAVLGTVRGQDLHKGSTAQGTLHPREQVPESGEGQARWEGLSRKAVKPRSYKRQHLTM